MAVKGHVKALLLRPMRRREAEMPLADLRGAIAILLQGFRQRDLRRFEVVFALRRQHRRIRRCRILQEHMPGFLRRRMSGGAGDAMPCGILSREQRSPRGRAQRLRVGIRETHRPRGKAVDVRRLVVFRAIHAAIHPAHVIDEEKNDVRLRGGGGMAAKDRKERKKKRKDFG